MGKYGEVAVRAVDLIHSGKCQAPREAWDQAAASVFPERQRASRSKGCPRSAFLGLCEEGLVSGVPRGHLSAGPDNKEHALQAVRHLRKKPALGDAGAAALWRLVLAGRAKVHNQQMDVVLALWSGGYIKPTT